MQLAQSVEQMMVTPKAVIFGAIGTIAETSDIQRQAFNAAFAAAGLDWVWSIDAYRDLLEINGGQNRLRAYRDADPIRAHVTDAMIGTLHQAKTDHYVAQLAQAPLTPRAGVVELIAACQNHAIPVAFCTSTSAANVNAIGAALADVLPFDQFATIVTIERIARPKPAPDAYHYCLEQLGLTADQVIAIEDTPASLAAAKAAGIPTVVTPGATTAGQDFAAADWVLPSLVGAATPYFGLA
jgi:HAD superfamily hydrolase (TIGR01509 family)